MSQFNFYNKIIKNLIVIYNNNIYLLYNQIDIIFLLLN